MSTSIVTAPPPQSYGRHCRHSADPALLDVMALFAREHVDPTLPCPRHRGVFLISRVAGWRVRDILARKGRAA